jgi:ferredoxin
MTSQQQKVLWGRSGGRCANCGQEILAEGGTGKVFPLAEQAHITARSSRGPRGGSKASSAEREDASNYILLCPTCHTTVDKNPGDWPVARLIEIKRKHEDRVRKNGEQVTMSELAGVIEVVAVDSDRVDGAVIEGPTRIKHGTRISVDATRAKEVTGLRIQRPPKGDENA